jgi:TetR/AcrR family transcriptional regulator, upper aerobic nicotinate degradation pathway regulator
MVVKSAAVPRKRAPTSTRPPARKPDHSESATRNAILSAATEVFSKHGYDGGSIDKITQRAKTHDRMIYYYFGSKEKLFIAALEAAYRDMAEAERELALDLTEPVLALQIFIDFVWRYYQAHPEFIALLNAENMQRGKHIAKSARAGEYAFVGISLLDCVLAAGVERGVFRADVTARDVYLLIASMGYFYQSNRYTLSAFLSESTQTPAALARWFAFINSAVLRTVSADVVSADNHALKKPAISRPATAPTVRKLRHGH